MSNLALELPSPGPHRAPPESEDARAILEWASTTFGDRIALSTSLGPQSLVILDLLHGMGRTLPTFVLDTGLLFAETHALKRRIEERYGITIRAIRPRIDLADQAAEHGPGLWARNPDQCCYLRKVLPLRRALGGLDAWVTGIRRDHSPGRANARAVAWDEQYGLLKVNPLVAWTRADVDAYVAEHRVPTNLLLSQGYSSLGCQPCTSIPDPTDDDERAGRWAGRGKTECGIHNRFPILNTELNR